MIPVSRLTDSHSCPIPGHGTTPVNSASGDTIFNFLGAARVGDVCGCGAVITTGFPSINVNGRPLAHLGSPTSHGGRITSGSPDSFGGFQGGGGAGPIVNFAMMGAIRPDGTVNEVRMNQLMADPENTALMAQRVGALVEENDCVFAKSCLVPIDSTEAGTSVEPATNFGRAVVLGSVAMPASATGGITLGHVAGQVTVAEAVGAWSLRGVAAAAGTAASTLLLALWPSEIGDSTLSEEQLRSMTIAPTRVRFQFRRDAEGVMRVYGIHTSANSGEDRVPVVHAEWNAEHSEMHADVGGATITWTPNRGPVVQAPTTYPGARDELEKILVHPIPEGIDTQIEAYPGEDVTWQDGIIVFPADSGVPPLYLVFAKPAVNPLEVGAASDLQSGSKRDGLDIDHMPSQKALETYIWSNNPGATYDEIQLALRGAPSIAIPRKVHQKYSETYGGRNTKAQQQKDAADLEIAVNKNLDAIKPYLLEEGYADMEIEKAREELHKLHREQGWY